jgi:N-acetylglucosamine malate deacetylase 1
MIPKDSFEEVFRDKKQVLVVMAHPDDNEVTCGGLVARLIDAGKQVRVVVTTNGEKGTGDSSRPSSELAAMRLAEQRTAAKLLGVPEHECFNLGIPDGELEASIMMIKRVVYHVRQFQPDLVITHNPHEVINTFSSKKGIRWVNHRDHRHTGLIATDAVYPYSRDTAFFPDQLAEGLKTHTVTELLYSDWHERPENIYFDITGYVDAKRQALSACPSVIPGEHVEEYIEETKIGARYFEQLGYFKGLY